MIEQLGKPLTALAIHQRLGIGINQVYANARELGGVRIGKKWVFFEANVLQALGRNYADATNEQTDRETGVVRENYHQGGNVHKEDAEQKGRAQVGKRHAKGSRVADPNRHGLIIHALQPVP